MTTPTSSSTPPPRDDDFDTIVPAQVQLGAAATDGPSAPSRGMPPAAWIALSMLLLLGAAVVLLLPDQVAQQRDTPRSATSVGGSAPGGKATATEDAPGIAADAAIDPDTAPWRQLQLEQARRDAQDILAEFVDLQEQLARMGVEHWGAEDLAKAVAMAEAGDAVFLETDYAAAEARYREAVSAAQALLARADEALQDALQRGTAALDTADAAAAIAAFELATRLDPALNTARSGLQRARALDEVLALLAEAEAQAAAGDLAAAQDTARRAAALSPASPRPPRLLTQLQERAATQSFNNAVSAGYAALSRNETGVASEAFRRALALRPNASEAADGLRIAEQQALDTGIAGHRREAERLVAAQRWRDAAEAYRAALALDGTLAFAQRGLARAQRRAQLDEDLQDTLADPLRLNDDALLADAQALLEEAVQTAAEDPDPALLAQVAALRQTLQLAVTPVDVSLTSDEATEVIIYTVGSLGSFDQVTLSLRPGVYRVVGTRRNYKDVGMELQVRPGGMDGPVRVACTERLN